MKYRFLTAALTAAILLGGCSAQKTEEPSAASNTGTVVSTAEMADKITENSAVLEFIKFAEAQGMTTTEPKEANEGCALTLKDGSTEMPVQFWIHADSKISEGYFNNAKKDASAAKYAVESETEFNGHKTIMMKNPDGNYELLSMDVNGTVVLTVTDIPADTLPKAEGILASMSLIEKK